MFSSRSNRSAFSYASSSSILNSKETLDFLRNPIDSRNEPIPEISVKSSSRTNNNINYLLPQPKKISEKEIEAEWQKRLSKMHKPSYYLLPKPQVIQPHLMMQQTGKTHDPLNRLSVEEISNTRSKSQNSAAKAAVIIPKTRKIPYALRSNPIGHKRVLLR